MRTLYFLALPVAFALTGTRSIAQDDPIIHAHRIDSIFQCYSQEKPGGQLAVSLNGQVVYSRAWGMANLETGTPLTTESLIEAGSASKQFTAAAVLLLEQQGKLKLDDPVDKYIPGLPSYGAPILIRHLIHHTSGLREWSDIAEFAGSPQVLRVMDNNAALRIICRQKSINNRPGEAFYSYRKLGGQALLDKQTAPDTLNDGRINNYGAGLFVEHNMAKPTFHHGGATAAYRARLICSPALGLSIAWLSNTSMLDTAGLNPATAVLQMLAKPEDITPLPRKKSDVQIDRKKLQQLTGLYKSAQSMRHVEITLGKDGLLLSDVPLEPVDSLRFYFFNILLSFDNAGGLAVTSPSSEPMAYYRADSAAAKTPLHEFAGKYFSDEAETAIEIAKSAAGAEMQLVSGARFALLPCSKDRFLVPDLKTDLLFKRNKKNEITAVELTTPRTLGLRFEKAKSSAPGSFSSSATKQRH